MRPNEAQILQTKCGNIC